MLSLEHEEPTMWKPKIYGWRLVSGVILWLVAALLVFYAWLRAPDAHGLPVEAATAAVVAIGLAAAFWRGSVVARVLAIVPAFLMFLVPFFLLSLVGPFFGVQLSTVLLPSVVSPVCGLLLIVGIVKPGTRP